MGTSKGSETLQKEKKKKRTTFFSEKSKKKKKKTRKCLCVLLSSRAEKFFLTICGSTTKFYTRRSSLSSRFLFVYYIPILHHIVRTYPPIHGNTVPHTVRYGLPSASISILLFGGFPNIGIFSFRIHSRQFPKVNHILRLD